jgi:hypothetical protein
MLIYFQRKKIRTYSLLTITNCLPKILLLQAAEMFQKQLQRSGGLACRLLALNKMQIITLNFSTITYVLKKKKEIKKILYIFSLNP